MKKTALALTFIVALIFSTAGEILLVRSAAEKPTMQWSRDYRSLGEQGKAVVQTLDGGYVIAAVGESPGRCLLLKVNAYGDVQWSKKYGDTIPTSLVRTNDGGFALAGFNNYGLANFIKTDSEGNMQWNKTYGSPYGANYQVKSFIQTSDGGYALAGYTYNWNTDWFIKTDESGNIQWNRTYGMRYGFSLVEADSGGYVILVGGDIATQSAETFLVKVDPSGNVQWNKTGVFGSSLIKADDVGYVLAGSSMMEKRDAQGTTQWSLSLGESIVATVAQAPDGGYVVAGNTGEDPLSFWSGRIAKVIKISASGVIEWISNYPSNFAPSWASSIIATGDGYVFTGMKGYSQTCGDGAVWLVKIAEEPTPTPAPSSSPTPTPSPSSSPSPSPFPSLSPSPSTPPSSQQPEPLPKLVALASVASAVAGGAVVLVYMRKRKR